MGNEKRGIGKQEKGKGEGGRNAIEYASGKNL
jgi:hypothetical protein